ncbi:MAG: porin [Vicinamibacterales bacterium]
MTLLLMIALVLGLADGAFAQAPLTQWYRSETNPVVQQVTFTGRFQHDFLVLDADQGDLNESNVRRLRLGPRVTLFRTLTLHTEVELNPQERDPLYVRLTDAYLQWTANRRFVLTVGKQGAPFTLDGATSSKELLTIDRSNLANNFWFPQEYLPGLSVSGRASRWTYRAGVYSAGAMNREFGEFNGSYATLGSVGYDFAERFGTKEALLSANYVHQPSDADNTFTRPLEHIVSVNLKLESGRWGVRTDVAAAAGAPGQPAMQAVTLMPFLNLTARVQPVARYTYIRADGPNGIRLATYESRVASGRGDRYDELYVGANYYVSGHRLKVQSGLQWASLTNGPSDDEVYRGLSWTTGIRVGW